MKFKDIIKVFKRKYSVFFCYYPTDTENPHLDEMFRFLKLQTNIKLYSFEDYGQSLNEYNSDAYEKWAEDIIDKVDLVIFYLTDEFLKSKTGYKMMLRAYREKFFFEQPEKSRYVSVSDRSITETELYIANSSMTIPMEWQEFYKKSIIESLYFYQPEKGTAQIYNVMKDEGLERIRRNLIITGIVAGIVIIIAVIILIVVLVSLKK